MAELCELVGRFIFDNMNKFFKFIKCCKGDGLATLENCNGHLNNKFRKDLIKLFKDHDVQIIFQCYLKTVDFFDLTCDLQKKLHKPYKKPNNSPKYLSNHPPNIITQPQKSIAIRTPELKIHILVLNLILVCKIYLIHVTYLKMLAMWFLCQSK